MNIIVTGAAGYIGGEIALLLKDAGNRYRDHVAHEKYQVVKIQSDHAAR